MRRAVPFVALLGLVLASCGGHRGSAGPAWPKSAGYEEPDEDEEDGGESLEPRGDGDLAAIESSDDDGAVADDATEVTVDADAETPAEQPVDPGAGEAAPGDAPPPEGAIIIEGAAPKPDPAIDPSGDDDDDGELVP